jgi:hypothetical protein
MCTFVKLPERTNLRDVEVAKVKTGMGGRYGNKVRSIPLSLP